MDRQMQELTTSAAVRLADALDCVRDLEQSHEAVTSLLHAWPEGGNPPPIARAVWSAALVFYVRAFSMGVRRFDLARFLSVVGNDADVAHKYFKNIRDKHIAHSVNSMSKARILVGVGPPPQFELLLMGPYLDTWFIGRETAANFQSLVGALVTTVRPEIELLRASAEASFRALSPTERQALPMFQRRVDGPDDAGTSRRRKRG